ncbi:tetratricopeptide repeat protein [Undibacterium sp. Ren11W]|uniref:tetratricopeptide repeat protein n=1 Tax=Undibacterium sp. Ren11W TaxID=3413045 RepID=UPI003BF17B00
MISVAASLSGCANLSRFAQHAPEQMPTAPDLSAPGTSPHDKLTELAEKSSSKDKLPDVTLNEELLYKILTSEIAYQRGNWQSAYVTILGAAQQTRDPRLAKRAAEMALAVRQPAEALTAIRLWRELAPDSSEASQYYLGFMIVNGNLAEIQKVYSEKLQSATPQQYGLIMLQAQRLLARARDKKAAFVTLEEILSPYKASMEAHLALAQGAYNNNDNPRAISEAQVALALKPDSQLAILTIAQASSKPDALREIAAFVEKNPDSRDVRLAYASMLIEMKQLDKASLEFERLLRDKPDDIASIYTLGALAMDSGQFKLAEKYFLSYLAILEAHPEEERDPTPSLVNLAQIALERKDNAAALSWLSKVDSYEGKNAAWLNIQFRRAQIMAKDGKLKEALDFLKNLKAANESEEIQILQAQSQLLRNAKRGAEAMAVMETAVLRFPNNADLLYDYAMLAESQKKIEQMEVQLKRVIELAPNSQHAYNALGYSYADRNIHLPEALSLIEKALQLAPEDPFILDSLGWVKFRLGLHDEAEQALRRAYQLRADPEIAIHLGEVLWTAGKKEDARAFWRDAKSKDADNESLKSTLLRLNVKL